MGASAEDGDATTVMLTGWLSKKFAVTSARHRATRTEKHLLRPILPILGITAKLEHPHDHDLFRLKPKIPSWASPWGYRPFR